MSHIGDGKLFTNQDLPLVPHYTEIEAIYDAINNYLDQISLEILNVCPQIPCNAWKYFLLHIPVSI
jgi:hypothetical protein